MWRTTDIENIFFGDWIKVWVGLKNLSGVRIFKKYTMDNRQGVMAVFVDFMKAFDRVWHDGLILQTGSARSWVEVLGVVEKLPFWSVYSSACWPHLIRAVPNFHRSSSRVPPGPNQYSSWFSLMICQTDSVYQWISTLLIRCSTKKFATCSSASDMTSLQDAVTASSAWAELCGHGRFGHAKTGILRIGKTAISSTMQKTMVIEN